MRGRSGIPTFSSHPSDRGTALVAVLIALIIAGLMVMAITAGVSRDQTAMLERIQGVQAQYAAEGAANMAIKELMDSSDRDSDGSVGGVSNDGNTVTDPTINTGTRLWASASTSSGTTTVAVRSQNTQAARAVQLQLAAGASSGNGATVLLVVGNAASLDSQEAAKRTLMQGWGYTVTTISDTASQAAFDTACRSASVVYISETVLSGNVSTKLTNQTIGVIIEESSVSDELGFSSTMSTISSSQINITSGTHYITSTLGTGVKTLFTASQPVRHLSGSVGSFTTLGTQPSTSNVTMAVFERGDTLTPSGTAQGRRVYLPWGNTGMDITQLSADGLTILQRSIEWCILPVAWYRLDQSSGTTATDSVAGRNGTLVNGPVWTSGRISNGLRFDGADDYVSIPNATAFQVTRALSITGWIRQTSAWPTSSNVCPILRKGDACNNNWQLCIQNGRVAVILDSCDDATPYVAGTTLSINAWHHVAVTWDGSEIRLYLNGVSDMSPAARSTTLGTDTRAVYLGGRIGNTDISTGIVDDVRFYNRALTAAEVAAIAAGGKPTVRQWTNVAP